MNGGMVRLEATVTRESGVSLVELLVENPAPVARRVRVENRLETLHPPRTNGVPERGWDDGGVEIVLAPEERRALGYAGEGPPADPPAEIERVERVEDADGGESARADLPSIDETSAAGVVRALGDPRPPADAVPVPGAGDGSETEAGPAEATARIGTWFDEVEGRIARAETLAACSSVAGAARAVDEVGGLTPVEDLLREIEIDAERLRAIEERARAFRARGGDAVDGVPMDTFRRLV